jgi:hypothetical protein
LFVRLSNQPQRALRASSTPCMFHQGLKRTAQDARVAAHVSLEKLDFPLNGKVTVKSEENPNGQKDG